MQHEHWEYPLVAGICTTTPALLMTTCAQQIPNSKHCFCCSFIWGHSGPWISLSAQLGLLKSSEWRGWRALEPRLQPRTRRWFSRQGPTATRLSVVNRNKSSHQMGWGHEVKPDAASAQMSLSVYVFSLSLWGSNGEGRMNIQERMCWCRVIFKALFLTSELSHVMNVWGFKERTYKAELKYSYMCMIF